MSLDTARRVLRIEAQAIQDVLARLDATFEKAVDLLFACKGRVVTTGMGKSGLVARKISATFSSTGTPSFFLHPAEALHGDLGMLARGDILIAVSYGGETEEIIGLLEALKRLEIPLLTLTGKIHSTLAEAGEVALDVSVKEEACSLNLAPTASTTIANRSRIRSMKTVPNVRLRETAALSRRRYARYRSPSLAGTRQLTSHEMKMISVESRVLSGYPVARTRTAQRRPRIGKPA